MEANLGRGPWNARAMTSESEFSAGAHPIAFAAIGVALMAMGGTILVHLGEAPELYMFLAVSFFGAGLFLLIACAVIYGVRVVRAEP